MQQMLHGNKGVSIIEILVIVTVIIIGLTSLLTLATFSLTASSDSKETVRATALAQETLEAVRSFRDNVAWNNVDGGNQYNGLGVVATGTAYYLSKSAGPDVRWQLLQGTETIDSFSRKIVFDSVSRNPSTDDIESTYNAVNNDSDTRKAIVTVSWGGKQIEIFTYFTNWR